jgi:hypothetical protein
MHRRPNATVFMKVSTKEMAGASLFLYALLATVEEQFGEIRIHLARSGKSQVSSLRVAPSVES